MQIVSHNINQLTPLEEEVEVEDNPSVDPHHDTTSHDVPKLQTVLEEMVSGKNYVVLVVEALDNHALYPVTCICE